jgi:hypothetical protein
MTEATKGYLNPSGSSHDEGTTLSTTLSLSLSVLFWLLLPLEMDKDISDHHS